ncbi:DUF4935 domain-containing protein [Psychrobacter sp. NG25]|uniref:PIN domain-containing protein n=1 Tax=Psychrobacter sp. NG25 TaxID=2782005 RepID=UPI00188455CB|nr:PIN domain-containing protein [Psychrobacter sp. NG25]MBF0659229.1 DUF4935 domain-containing protein [Psychrobacter sp. NG25]
MDKTLIELDFGAISIDNSTFKSDGYRFDEGILAQLVQFKDSPVKLVQTDIVHNEAIKHIGQELEQARSSIFKAIRSADKQLKIAEKIIEQASNLLSIEGSEFEIAESRLNKFYESTGCLKLEAKNHVDIEELMQTYFSTEAPFEKSANKKNEFPDAIALLTLENWAEENDINIIAVSQDKGWSNYAKSSNRITIINSLAQAFEKFQPHNKVSVIIKKIREDALLQSNNHVLDSIQDSICNSLYDEMIDVEANSAFHYDWDDLLVSYISHELELNRDGLVDVHVVSIDTECILLSVKASVEIQIEASFNFYVKDSIDKDYIGLSSNYCITSDEYETDILVTLAGNFSEDFEGLEVCNVEVLDSIGRVDFGFIEPDWGNEYDE